MSQGSNSDSNSFNSNELASYMIGIDNITTLNMESNITINSTTQAGVRDEWLATVEIAVQATILFLAVTSNLTVLLILGFNCKKRKLSRMNLLILHLSIADLFVALFNVLPQLIWDITFHFYGGDILCRVVKYAQIVGLYASSYILIATAVDRYIALCHPIMSQTWSNKRVHIMVGTGWLISLLFSLPQIAIFSNVEVSEGLYNCWGHFSPEWTLQAYITWFTLAIYILPTIILIITYGRICYVVWRSAKYQEKLQQSPNSTNLSSSTNRSRRYHTFRSKDTTLQLSPSPHRTKLIAKPRRGSLSRSKVKTVKLTLAVIICYFLCWSPFFISQMWAAWDPNAPFQGHAMTIIMLLASLNSCTNPWIYLIFTDNLGNYVAQFCGKSTQGRRTPGRNPQTSTWTSSYRHTTVTRVDLNSTNTPRPCDYIPMELAKNINNGHFV